MLHSQPKIDSSPAGSGESSCRENEAQAFIYAFDLLELTAQAQALERMGSENARRRKRVATDGSLVAGA
jgi:hypothetical protein